MAAQARRRAFRLEGKDGDAVAQRAQSFDYQTIIDIATAHLIERAVDDPSNPQPRHRPHLSPGFARRRSLRALSRDSRNGRVAGAYRGSAPHKNASWRAA